MIGVESLYSERLSDLPVDIGFFIDQPIKGSLFSICGFTCHKGKLKLEVCSYQDDDSWMASLYNPFKIIDKLKEVLTPDFEYFDQYCDYYTICFKYEESKEHYLTVEDFVEEALNKFKIAEQSACLGLAGFKWKEDYHHNEMLFTNEAIMPLLRKMGFMKIFYSHGVREYGKDLLFSERDKFGNIIYYGMQVKVGVITGKVNGEIDKIIGQIDDAFNIPFEDDNRQLKYINYFFVVISGKLTKNASEKLLYKIPKEYSRHVKILDKERVIKLLAENWNVY